jgi:UDP-glucose 6-dehydrogenase
LAEVGHEVMCIDIDKKKVEDKLLKYIPDLKLKKIAIGGSLLKQKLMI